MDANLEAIVEELLVQIRQAVRPSLGNRVNDVVGTTEGGDTEFRIDEIAEQVVEGFAAKIPWLATYTEARGLSAKPEATHVLIVDPIDGTRPARVGLEMCVVSVAIATLSTNGGSTFADLIVGGLAEIKGDALEICRIETRAEKEYPVRSLDEIAWAFEIAGRPMSLMMPVLGPLIDRSSIKGGCFTFSSSAYAVWQVTQGKFDAFVDPARRIYDAMNYSGFGMKPYDLAAAYVIAKAHGVTITDAAGKSLANVPILGDAADFTLSCVAAGNSEVHSAIIAYLDQNIIDESS